ncbi:putative lipoprotein [Hyphomonas oceanitis SCH89]|uniref:Putative lipoprotein n=1 Tax=Hyphomonas oceanitis SCH89 TaxID=1280953 RepID=A0A059GBZ5_9PROT|nr:putative lipoprotein [Hyphomonas oceanitis SCH89]
MLSETEDKLRWFIASRNDDPIVFSEADNISITDPCHVVGATDSSQDFILVGQRNRGLSVVRIVAVDPDGDGIAVEFDDSVIYSLDVGRSLCHVFPTVLPERVSPEFVNGDLVDLPGVIAVDFDTNEIVLIGDTTDNGAYEVLEVIPIDTQSTEPMKIVDVFSRGNPSLVPRYIAILLTSGIHDGEHRLVVVSQSNDTKEISQETFSWSGGVPVALLSGPFVGVRPNDQTRPDLVVISGTSEQSLVFENTVPEESGVATVPSFAAPKLFDVGIGAGSAVAAISENYTDTVVLVSFPDTGEIREIRPPGD